VTKYGKGGALEVLEERGVRGGGGPEERKPLARLLDTAVLPQLQHFVPHLE